MVERDVFIRLNSKMTPFSFRRLDYMKMERQRWPEMPLILGRFEAQYVAMVTKQLRSNCGAHLVESYCKESNISDTNWLRYLFSSYLIKIWLSI